MDIELYNLINYIQSIKQDLYKKHKPQLIDEKTIILGHDDHSQSNDNTLVQSKDYIKLMQQQRKILYKNNLEAQEQAAKRVHDMSRQVTKNNNTNSTTCGDFSRPWNKLPNNLKIQSLLRFVDNLCPKLDNEPRNQLRYLLTSAIANKKLLKNTDIDYNVTDGIITKIPTLTYDGKLFSLCDSECNVTFPFGIEEPKNVIPPKKKLILIRKS